MGAHETIIYRLVIKIPVLALIVIFDFLGPKKGRDPYESGASKPVQKVDPLGEPFGSPIISK